MQLMKGQLHQLLHLDLSGNQLQELPDSFEQLTHLRVLNLSSCSRLAVLQESLQLPASLQVLILQKCSQLIARQASLAELSNLELLDLGDCSKLASLPSSAGGLTALKQLSFVGCGQLLELPDTIGDLASLKQLDLSACAQLAALPESVSQLAAHEQLNLSQCIQLGCLPVNCARPAALQLLDLSGCRRLTDLPESLGKLKALNSLHLGGCRKLAALPQSMKELTALTRLDLQRCSSLVQPLPDKEWAPQQQIAHILDRQDTPAIIHLATQQETMLTTLERMSWLAVLLATATFIAFMQPPGGLDDDSKQVLVSNSTACAPISAMRAHQAAVRACALSVFFVLDGMSFGFSIGCVMMIIVMSMPRRQYHDEKREAGRFWGLLLVTWVLLYATVLTGFGAFIASGLAVHNMASVVVGPVIPDMILLVTGIVAIVHRFRSLHPGWQAVWIAFFVQRQEKEHDHHRSRCRDGAGHVLVALQAGVGCAAVGPSLAGDCRGQFNRAGTAARQQAGPRQN
jgi:hypothetical protein